MSPAGKREHVAQAAERMRLARQLAGITQAEAARKLKVAERTYARWENGETAGFLGDLDKIAKLYGTTKDAILQGEDGAPVGSEVAELRAELAELRALLLDPARLRAAADALAAEAKPARRRRRGA